MQVCPSCQSKNRESARFCDQCGARLALPASVAEADAPKPGAGHNYTPKHLAEKVLKTRAAMVGERKRVTVLFADIKGSTQLAEEIGAEAWHGVLDQFFAILSSAVHRFEGTVNQYTGDGIMALFGAPIAHEDHAQRGCLAALAMQREVRTFAMRLREERNVELALRVGLNTGEVVVGRIGDDLRMDYTAKGMTVNLAARMEQLCVPGSIYLSRYTATQVGADFQLGDLGDREVHGASHPIRVYELQGEYLTGSRQHRSWSRSVQPLIGRAAELQELKAALQKVAGGQGQIVAVSGEPGVGKSRLCREFAQMAWSQGMQVHHAAGIPYGAALPMVPVRALLRSRLQLADDTPAEQIRAVTEEAFKSANPQRSAVIPLLADFLGADSTDASGSLRSQMLERIARFLPRVKAPQVLIIEDMHNADPATEDFLMRLCEQIPANPTLLLLNYRSDYATQWFAPFLDLQLPLKPLGTQELEQLALGLLGDAAELVDVARAVSGRAQGNAFFVEEAIKALAESGHLEGASGQYRLARPIDEWPIPDSVHALIAGRIDRLPEQQKILMQAASVMGRKFDGKLLADFADVENAAAQLAALAQSGFINACNDGDYEFSHPLTREVAYHSQLDAQRAHQHAALAGALAQRTPLDALPDRNAANVAYHWELAEQWDQAGAWNLQAARWLAPRDMEATLSQFRRAIQNLDRADYSYDVLRLRIAARAGLIRTAQFCGVSREEVEHAYHDAWKMAEEFQDVEMGAELLFSYGSELLRRGEMEKAAQLTAEAVGHAESVDAQELINRFRFSILMTHNAAGRLAEGRRLACAGGDEWLKREIGDDNFVSRGFYGALCTWQGRLNEASRHIEGALDWAEHNGRESIWLCSDYVDWAGFSGNLDHAVRRGQLAVLRAQNYGSPFFKALALRALGLALCHQFDFSGALEVLEQARPLAAQGEGAYPLESSVLAVLGAVYLGMGQFKEAQRVTDEALGSAQRCQMRLGELQAWLMRMHIPGSDPEFVAKGLRRMEELIDFTGAEVFRPWWLLARSRHIRLPGERDALRRQAAALLLEMGAKLPARSSLAA